ncbi:MAG: ABC transporter substrate-binding protein, partial [Dehalococcoidia bacterium]|nr:ABC transporter substrate-binding protein [Dehalococcoidia bacterium]
MKDGGNSARIDRRQFLKVASLAGGGIFLVACAPAAVAPTPTAAPKAAAGTPAATGAASPTAAAKPKVSATIQFATTASGIGLQMLAPLVAMEMFFKEEGITQTLISYAGGGDTVRGLLEGGNQVGEPAPNALVIAVDQGQPLRIIAEDLPFPTIFWLVKADSPLKTMKDIKGKKLGYSRAGSVSQTYAFSALRALGFKPDTDVTMVAAGGSPDELTAVRGGIIDVAWSNDPLMSQELLKKDLRILGSAADYIPDWSEAMLATTADYAKANSDILTAYLRAHQKAMDYIRSNPDGAATIWAKG